MYYVIYYVYSTMIILCTNVAYIVQCVYYKLIHISVKSSVVDIYNPGELVCNVFNFFSSSEDGD